MKFINNTYKFHENIVWLIKHGIHYLPSLHIFIFTKIYTNKDSLHIYIFTNIFTNKD